MEIVIKTRQWKHDDDIGFFYYDGKFICKEGCIDDLEENGLDTPVERYGFEPDDEFKDMAELLDVITDHWDNETKTYKYKKYELRILDIR